MLESLSIKNFRNFRSLQIESLSRVNLVVGKNNVGKSNLLDAVSLYVKQGDAKHLFELLEHSRECRRVGDGKYVFRESLDDALASLFCGRAPITIGKNDQIDISAIHNNDDRYSKLTIRYLICLDDQKNFQPHWTTIETFLLETQKSEKFAVPPDTKTLLSNFVFFLFFVDNGSLSWSVATNIDPSILRFLPTNLQCNYPIQHVRTQFVQNRDNADFWDDVALTNKEENTLDALRILLPDIARLSYKSDKDGERIPYVKLRSQDTPIPLYSLGEGINRVLTLVLHLVNAENGTLLIDEFENGLHYTIQEPLWRMIFQVAEKLNVQVFATTHSEDCLRAFNEVLKDDAYSGAGQVISLAKVKDDIRCSVYGSQDMEEVFEKGLEVR